MSDFIIEDKDAEEVDLSASRVVSEQLQRALERMGAYEPGGLLNPDGSATQRLWRTEDGWYVGYTTQRIRGGPFAGKFAVLAYRPYGPGSRSGNPKEWRRVVFSKCATRTRARARAEKLYYNHSPKARRRHGYPWG